MSAIPMPLLDRALEEMPREELITALRLARFTFGSHLQECNTETNKLIDSRNWLQNELNEVSEDRNALRRDRTEFRALKDKLASYVVGLFWERAIKPNLPPLAIARKKLVTLAMVLEDPANYLDHVHCEVDGHDIFCAGGH